MTGAAPWAAMTSAADGDHSACSRLENSAAVGRSKCRPTGRNVDRWQRPGSEHNSGAVGRRSALFEQLVCVFGDVFVGSARSTFTAGINRMRWFSHVPVQARLCGAWAKAPIREALVEAVNKKWSTRRDRARTLGMPSAIADMEPV